MSRRLSLAQARRVALAAQGFGRPRPVSVGMRQVQSVIDTVAQFQIDSVNVFARAHLMPLFSRMGPYDVALLTRCAEERPRRLYEYWGHEASLIDVRLEPALRFRARGRRWQSLDRLAQERPGFAEEVAVALASANRPCTARELDDGHAVDTRHWGWNWSDTKIALEGLFTAGRVSVAGRTPGFERRYAPREAVLPATAVGAPTPTDEEAHLALTRRAAAALGVAGLACLTDYFRTQTAMTQRAVATLEASGELIPVSVEGWTRPAWLWHEAARPRTVQATTIVSPFDSLVFERARTKALFGFDYRIEIYTPSARRRHGYYVYPFLFEENLDARFDLKADRAAGRLLVQASWLEEGAHRRADAVARAAVTHLREAAAWRGLGEVQVVDRGNFATSMAAALD